MSVFIKQNGEQINLMPNGLTFVVFKANFKKDLLKSILDFLTSQNENIAILERFSKMTEKEFLELNENDRNEFYDKFSKTSIDNEFIVQFIAALIISSEANKRRDINEVMAEIPAAWLDQNSLEFKEIIQLMVSLVPEIQKKK